MRCYVCGKETTGRRGYCDRCHAVLKSEYGRTARREALRVAYDERSDGFRCHWSGVLLETKDRWNPFHLFFDHLIPVKDSKLVASSALFNQMKTELGPDEFHRAIHELAAHHAGEPFDRDFIEFRYWGLKAPAPPATGDPKSDEGLTKVLVPECVICGRPPRQWSLYCARCYRFERWQGRDYRMHVKAMKEAYRPDADGFVCHYTGARLEEADPLDPWFLTFDHRTPGDRETIVAAAYWINLMKTALSEPEFWSVVLEYDRYLREGGEFDRDVVDFRWWRRLPRLR